MNRYLSKTGILMVTCLLLMAWAGGVFASQDYQSDVLDKMNQEQHYTQGPGWVIPSTLNTQNETNTQNTTIAFNNSKQDAATEPSPSQEADLPLKGPRGGGGGEQTANIAATGPEIALPEGEGQWDSWEKVFNPETGELIEMNKTISLDETGRSFMRLHAFGSDDHGNFYQSASYFVPLDETGLSYIIFRVDPTGNGGYSSWAECVNINSYYEVLDGSLVQREREGIQSGNNFYQNYFSALFTQATFVELQEIQNINYNAYNIGYLPASFTETTYGVNNELEYLKSVFNSYENLGYSVMNYSIDDPYNPENILPINQTILRYELGSQTGAGPVGDMIKAIDGGYNFRGVYGTDPVTDTDNMQNQVAINPIYIDSSSRISDIGYEDMQFSSGGLLDIVPGYGQYTLAAPSNFAEGGYFAPNDSWTSYDNTTEDPGLKYARDLYFIRLAVNASQDTQDLGDIVSELSAKTDRTDMENNLLEAAQAVIIDSEYIDDGTAKGFSEAFRYIRMAESMKGILEGVDFTAISRALEGLVKEQSLIYGRYVNSTEDAYAEIAKLLGISVEDEKLPDQYAGLVSIGAKTKLKILSDINLHKLMDKDPSLLSDNEKEALKVYQISVKPLLDEYKTKLIALLDKFIFEIKKTLMGADAATTVKEGGKFQALFLLNKKSE